MINRHPITYKVIYVLFIEILIINELFSFILKNNKLNNVNMNRYQKNNSKLQKLTTHLEDIC